VVFGTGAATVTAGAGADQFDFVDGADGGTELIANFQLGTDQLDLFGFGNSSPQIAVSGGNTTLTLADGTTIELLGVTDPTGTGLFG
jgi:Ca2+-binding RTX toxin-like protein